MSYSTQQGCIPDFALISTTLNGQMAVVGGRR